MDKIRTILIDDELPSLEVLEWEINGLGENIEILKKTENPVLGIQYIKELQPDLVFLDIEMPEITGLDLLQSFDPVFFNVVFTTAHENYAVEAIKNEALDYLLKPIIGADLKRAIERHRSRKIDLVQKQLSSLFESLNKQSKGSQKLVIPTSEGLEFVSSEEIIRCESSSNYTSIYLTSGQRIFIAKTLKEVEKMLHSEHFCRVHKSHLVNLQFIRRYLKSDGGVLVMTDGIEVPVSRSKKGDFLGNL